MLRTDVTYGQLDRVLRTLGFSSRLATLQVPARIYEDQKSGARLTLPAFADTDRVLEHHLILVRTTLDAFGIADPTVFAAELQNAG